MVRQLGTGYLKHIYPFYSLSFNFIKQMLQKFQEEAVLPQEVVNHLKKIEAEELHDYQRDCELLIRPLCYLQPDEYSNLVGEGWKKILRKFELFEYLRRRSYCLYSLDELAHYIESQSYILEDEREKLFHRSNPIQRKVIQVGTEVFKILCESLRIGHSDNLLSKCSRILKKLRPKEVKLCFEIDSDGLGYDIRSHIYRYGLFQIGPFWYLTRFLEYIGHCEGELAVGVMAEMRKKLGDLGKTGALKLEHYSQAFECPERTRLDTTLEALDDRHQEKEDFEVDYLSRVSHAIDEEFQGS